MKLLFHAAIAFFAAAGVLDVTGVARDLPPLAALLLGIVTGVAMFALVAWFDEY